MYSLHRLLDIPTNSCCLKVDGNKTRVQNKLRCERVGKRVHSPFPLFFSYGFHEAHVFFAAGVVGKITKFIAQVVDPRPPTKINLHDKKKKHKVNGIIMTDANGEEYTPRAEYRYYEVEVDSLAKEYPESDERIRKWVCLQSKMTKF